ncbi:MAG: LUD domain-containing protein [Candidatus Marinimicrobia bacterium]|nr:LUD domain-containing protein [Candidatus Neomarinimicrobiota bacterium]MCF7828309.1 LUD domain-containing protein [Candidatus Neomarinimicrobiota bacterium]MCF7879516.1 LUD domain-containing protein [Candidatus Neomarinimicrobiota bacterium]
MTEKTNQYIDQFRAAAEGAGASVEIISIETDSVSAAISQHLRENSITIFASSASLESDLTTTIRNMDGIIEHPNDEELEAAWCGITGAFAGIARTGSICVAVGSDLAGSVSLFTRSHIALLNIEDLVYCPSDLLQIEESSNTSLLNNMVIITGPSATADMGELVRGVHGPGELHIILLE